MQLIKEESPHKGKVIYTVKGTKFEIDSHYELYKLIGNGAYGFVSQANSFSSFSNSSTIDLLPTDVRTNRKVAIKKVPKLFHDLIDGKRVLREVKLLKMMNHPNIVRVLEIMKIPNFEDFQEIYIVTELVDTDLQKVINSRQKLTTQHVQYFTYQLFKALHYIHVNHIVHRDLKPGNILVNANCELKICDFGLARGLQTQSTHMTQYVVTRWYRAPEILLLDKDYGQEIDMWSAGCILGELINGAPVFAGKDYLSQLNLIIEKLGTPSPEEFSYVTNTDALRYMTSMEKYKGKPFSELFPNATPLELDLLSKLLVFDPTKRLTAKQALQHPYFTQLYEKDSEKNLQQSFIFAFEFDGKEMTAEQLRKSMFEESAK